VEYFEGQELTGIGLKRLLLKATVLVRTWVKLSGLK